MKLIELEPRWFSTSNNPGIAGISFLCPHCRQVRLSVMVSHAAPHVIQPPIDHDISHLPRAGQLWQISGDAPTFDGLEHGGFDNVTLSPSVDASGSGHWHGFIVNGEVR